MGRVYIIDRPTATLLKLAYASGDIETFWKGFATVTMTKSAQAQELARNKLSRYFLHKEQLEKCAAVEKEAFWGLIGRGLGMLAGAAGKGVGWLGSAASKIGLKSAGNALANKASVWKNFSTAAAKVPGHAGGVVKNWAAEPFKAIGNSERILPSIKNFGASNSLLGNVTNAAFSPQVMTAAGIGTVGANLLGGATGIGAPSKEMMQSHNTAVQDKLREYFSQQTQPLDQVRPI